MKTANTSKTATGNKGANKGKGKTLAAPPAVIQIDPALTALNPESRSATVLTTGDLPAVAAVQGSETKSRLLSVIGANIDAFKAAALAAPAGSKDMPEKTAGQWDRLRNQVTQGFADNFDALRVNGVLSAAQHEGAIASLRSDKGVAAPVYGAKKLIDTIAMLSSGNTKYISDLHRAYCATLCESPMGADVANETIARGIATKESVSLTGTAPTQRSSSNYALSALGIVEATRIGAKMLDNAASRALRAVFTPGEAK